MEEQLDFMAVGDITTDAFIKISDVRIDTETDEGDHGYDEICFRFGDKTPYEHVEVVAAVGNAPNAGTSASRLGLKTGLVTNLGSDRNGEDMLAALEKESIDKTHVQVHEGKESNYHYVLWYKEDRTILVKHHDYPYSFPDISPAPRWLYLSSLSETSLEYHHQITNYLKEHPETKLAFQPGTFQMVLGAEELKDVYEASEIFFCNKEEAQRILDTEEEDIKVLLENMRALGPNIAVITDGPSGAHASDGEQVWYIPMYPDPKPPHDRTGAGDAFSSTVTAALASGKSLPEALSWGPINSMSVVQYTGAQKGLLRQEELREYLKTGPAEYEPRDVS